MPQGLRTDVRPTRSEHTRPDGYPRVHALHDEKRQHRHEHCVVGDTGPIHRGLILVGRMGEGSRTSFVPETGRKTLHRMRTDERRCFENAADFVGGSNERLEVLTTPTIGNRTTRKPYEELRSAALKAA